MKKSIVYSFAALAGFPAVVNAAEVNANTGATLNSWQGVYAIDATSVGVQAGATATQTVTLQPGKYQVKGDFSGVKVKFNAEGTGVTLGKTTDTSLIFNVSTAGSVKVSITSQTGVTFTMKDLEIDLVYDFDAANAVLNGKLATVKTAMTGYQAETGVTTRTEANDVTAGEIQKDINSVGATQTYNNYVKYELYKGNDANTIAVAIDALAKKAAELAAKQNEAAAAEETAPGPGHGGNPFPVARHAGQGTAFALSDEFHHKSL